MGKLNIKKKIENSSGFTLIEILIAMTVMAIVAISVVVLIDPFNQMAAARDTQRKHDLALVQRYLEQYYNDNGKYPKNDSAFRIIDESTSTSVTVSWGSNWKTHGVIPSDPRSSERNYAYYTSDEGKSYILYASLERAKDDLQSCVPHGSACPSAIGHESACGDLCNYEVTSSNQGL